MKLLIQAVFFLVLASFEAGAADLSSFGGLGEATPPQPEKTPFELRLGGFAHDPQSPEKGSADLNAEILLGDLNPSAPGSWWNVLILRPQMGATVNFVGKTSALYGGLTGTVFVYHGLFIEASFGGAANDGKAGTNVPPGYNAMGCNLSFHENSSIGYRLSENWSFMGTIEHFSNEGLCDRNRGLTNYGVRLGYSF
jgi:lipid A 3-O-deacylase